MSSLSRRNFTAPLFLVFLMVAMSWSSVLDNRHDAHTETTLSDIVVANVGWSSPTTLDSTDSVGYQSSLAIDSNDNLHVTYRDNTNGNLEYMAYDGSSWSTPVSLDSTDNVGYQSSLAIDSNDNLHATYFDATNQNLEYTTYDGSSWSTPISLDSTGHVGYDSSLAIDSNDNLHVTYLDYTNGNLEYMTYDGSSWSTPVSIDSSTDRVGWDSSLAIDSNDNLHVTSFDETNYNLEYMAYDGSSWSTPVSIDSTDNVGRQSSLAIDSSDNLHVTYLDETNWNLEYMTYDGSSWSTPVSLDSTDIVGSESSLSIDSNDNLHVTYYDNTNYNLEYMTYDGSSWSTPVSLDSTGNVGLYCSLAIDSNDNLHVTYFDAPNGNLEYVTYSTPAPPVISYSPSELNLTNNTLTSVLSPTNTGGSVGAFSTVSGIVNATLDSTGKVGEHNSIAIDSNDHSHLAYYYSYNAQTVEDLIYATDKSGSWVITTLDSADSVGMHTSIAIDSNDSVHISYYDETNNDLKYATDKSGSWVLTTVDSTGDVGVDTSIDIDSNDSVHISYYDSTNDDLKYATDKSGSWVNTTLDSSATMGRYSSIALDSNDAVHISYNDVTNRTLKYATDKSSTWVLSTLDSSNSVGRDTSIDIDSNDKIHISYLDYTSWDLRYATDKTGSWVFSTIDSAGNVGWYTSTALDSNDAVHISYYYDPMGNGNGEALKYATDKNGSWVMTTLVSISGKEMGRDNEIALDSNNEIHIVYQDQTSQDLLYLQSTTTIASGFSINSSLPSGLVFNTSTGTFSGTPTVILSRTMYTITGTNPNGTATAYINITVVDNLPNISYSPDDLSLTNNTASSDVPLSPTLTGSGVITSWTIHPTLPNGLSFSTSNGTITGTPIELLTRTMFIVNGTNTGGSSTAYINLTVVDNLPNISYSPDDLSLTNNAALSPTAVPVNTGGPIPSGANTTVTQLRIVDAVGDVGEYSSFALDSTGSKHISYYDATNGDLKYATDTTGSWLNSTIDSNGDVGQYSSIAVDSNDVIHISYYDESNGNLMYITNRSGSWVNTTIDSTGQLGMDASVVGLYTSIAIDSNAKVHLSYLHLNSSIDTYLKYATDMTGSWVTETAFNTTTGGTIRAGHYSSIALDSNDEVHISAYDDYNRDLIHVTKKTGSWVKTTVQSFANVGLYTSLAIDSNDDLHIAYQMGIYSSVGENLRYATYNGSTGWTLTEIDILGSVGSFASLALDSNGFVHISYYDGTNQQLKYTTNLNGSWELSVIDSVGVGSHTSISVDATGAVDISYYDVLNGDLLSSRLDSSYNVYKFTVSPDLPTGLELNITNGEISGTPTIVSPLTTYSVTATNTGGSSTTLINITVVDNLPNISYSPDDLSLTNNTASSDVPLSPTLTGSGVITSWTIHPTLPNGLSFSTSNGTIAGTPIELLTRTMFTVNGTNTGGSSTAYVNITVNAVTPVLSYTPDSLVLTNNSAMNALSPTTSGGDIVTWSIDPALSSGLMFNTANGEISGIPDALSVLTVYTISATNTGDTVTATVNITVNAVTPVLSYTPDSLVLTNNSAMTTLSSTTPGEDIVSWSIDPALPSGLTFNTANGEISGIPDALSVLTVYTVSATNTGGTVTATVNITVNAVTPVLSYSPDSFILTNNSAMTTFSPTTSGGDIVTWSIDPALSSGLTFNTASGEISGIPDALSVLTVYTISATNTGGTVTATVNITVNAEIAVISYSSSNLTLTRSLSMPTLSPTVAGGAVVSWEINPQLPSGLQFGSSNGSIWGASSVNMSQIQYTVWANNSGGSAVAFLNITVVEPVAIIGYSPDSLTLIRTQSMTSIMPVMSGGQVETWEVEPTLPLGLSFSNGVLSGTPEVNMTLTSFTIWANNSGGASFANITLLIHEPIPEVTYSPENIVLTRGQNITEIAPSLGEGMVAIWEISPSLPDGLVFENGGISGTPVVNFTMTQYTVIAQNSGGSYTVTFNLTVVEPVAILSIESNPPVLLRDNSSLALNITNDGGMVDVWEISPSLPDGLVMENGSVSGISSVNQSETIFTIWGNNSGGSDSVTFTLTVQEPEIPIVEQLPQQEPEVSINLFILSMIFFVPFVALIIVFKKHYELMY